MLSNNVDENWDVARSLCGVCGLRVCEFTKETVAGYPDQYFSV